MPRAQRYTGKFIAGVTSWYGARRRFFNSFSCNSTWHLQDIVGRELYEIVQQNWTTAETARKDYFSYDLVSDSCSVHPRMDRDRKKMQYKSCTRTHNNATSSGRFLFDTNIGDESNIWSKQESPIHAIQTQTASGVHKITIWTIDINHNHVARVSTVSE
ncbi:hypothetical protein J6590_001694 [Homalodisca vitripennis]|nr:hypothetical protein J6590_001694 [Homalodisca vitripennis]